MTIQSEWRTAWQGQWTAVSAGSSAEELQCGASERKESVKYRVRDRWQGCELGVLDAWAQSCVLRVIVKIIVLVLLSLLTV